ncbi:MAG: hypothetical protein N3F07_01460 [Candidatus Micrarchaeota archaeon]|nr:hypothetical protein [Candidatus Micrarchaeota archaeon]
MLRRIYTLNFLDAFIAGMTTVLIPLLMQSRGIGVAEIGIAFSLSPFIKLAVRLAGAWLADFAGQRAVYFGNACCNLLQSVCYLVGSSPAWFAAGKIFDGLRESLIFSVNRISVMALEPHRKHYASSSLLSGRLLYNAAGGVAVWALAAVSGFDLMLSAMACLSFYMALSSLQLKNLHKAAEKPGLSDFSLRGKGKLFYEAALVLSVGSWIYVPMVYMLMPIYLSLQGFTLSEIGILYFAYFAANGIMLHILSHARISSQHSAFFGALGFVAGIAGMLAFGKPAIPIFFLIMAAGDGFLGVLWEEINYLAIKGSKKRATELALVNTPAYVSMIISTAAAGFIASSYGYLALFGAFAISEVAFAAWGLRLVQSKK